MNNMLQFIKMSRVHSMWIQRNPTPILHVFFSSLATLVQHILQFIKMSRAHSMWIRRGPKPPIPLRVNFFFFSHTCPRIIITNSNDQEEQRKLFSSKSSARQTSEACLDTPPQKKQKWKTFASEEEEEEQRKCKTRPGLKSWWLRKAWKTTYQRKKSPRRMGETGASSSSSMGRWSGCWVRDWWRYDRRRQTEKKTGLRVYRNTILDLEKRRRKMGIRRRKKGTREEGSKQEAAEKKKDSELVWALRRRVGTRTQREREAVSEGGGERGSRSHRHLFGVATVAKSARGHTRNPKWKKAMLRRWDPLFLVPLSSLVPFLFFPFFSCSSSSSLLTRSFFGARLALHDLASCTALLDCNNS